MSPPTMVNVAAASGSAVAEKSALMLVLEVTLARTVWAPASVPRVQSVEACPLELVLALVGETEPPPAVTANVTDMPAMAALF